MQQTTMSTALFLLRLLCCCFRFAQKQEDAPAEHAARQRTRIRHSSNQGPLSSGTSSRPQFEDGYDADSESSNEDGFYMIQRDTDCNSDCENPSQH